MCKSLLLLSNSSVKALNFISSTVGCLQLGFINWIAPEGIVQAFAVKQMITTFVQI